MIFNSNAKRMELHTDVSSKGVAGMLFQLDEDDTLKLVYAVSRKTSDVDAMYHSSKLELMVFRVDDETTKNFPYQFTLHSNNRLRMFNSAV